MCKVKYDDKETAKIIFTATSTHLQEKQGVVVRDPGAIGNPVEKISLQVHPGLARFQAGLTDQQLHSPVQDVKPGCMQEMKVGE